jgi:hypothetical protein
MPSGWCSTATRALVAVIAGGRARPTDVVGAGILVNARPVGTVRPKGPLMPEHVARMPRSSFSGPLHVMCQDPPAQPFAGGADESGLLATLLARGAGLCADCIEVQTGIPATEVPVIIAHLRETVPLQIVRGPL